jgi:branched-chain amino acid transport system substrate-binding protein
LSLSTVALAAQQVAKAKNKVALITGAGTQALFGSGCTSTGFIWTFDTASQTAAVSRVADKPGTKWFLISPAYSYGVEMDELMRAAIVQRGGTVVGGSRMPVNTQDFSSVLATALNSGATHLGFAQAGHDGVRLVQQAHEFGIESAGMKLVAEYMFVTDVHSLERSLVQGMYNATTFYWDLDDETRAFSKRFEARMGRPPSEVHAGIYSSVLHYLRAVQAVGSTDGEAVSAQMRKTPVTDAVVRGGTIRADGRLTRDLYLVQVKDKAEARGSWDLYTIVARIPASEQSAAPSPACKLP